MAVRLLSNYFYNGNDFLDSRQAIVNTVDELKNWFDKEPENIIYIPDGFEIRVDNTWYVYEPTKEPNNISGYFVPRITEDTVKELLPEGIVKINNIIGTIEMN